MKMRVIYSKKARKDLRVLSKKEAQKIVSKIRYFSEQKDIERYAKKLKPPLDDLFRFRIGDFRVILDINNNNKVTILTILRIKHRKDIYR
ncbi:MAG TPA: type II toxin-antitoxin system RelE/ParE family toxin [Candidatus Kaiserbacteria bacterium]|nr:type II toxin-antitoxin system RelE/ParE family toxin [Candidatus Kaiserbacteria bacterium]